jgi:uncharacterized protein with PIN domain
LSASRSETPSSPTEKGSGHPAGLGVGDAFSHALAKLGGLPLLFKGEDLAQADIEAAWRSGLGR